MSAEREPLARPDGTDPDGFSRRVAEAYRAAVVTTSKPAKVLADEAGVPVTTVHRWIREARQRGHLKPGRADMPDPWQLVATELGVTVDRLRDVVTRNSRSGLRLNGR